MYSSAHLLFTCFRDQKNTEGFVMSSFYIIMTGHFTSIVTQNPELQFSSPRKYFIYIENGVNGSAGFNYSLNIRSPFYFYEIKTTP